MRKVCEKKRSGVHLCLLRVAHPLFARLVKNPFWLARFEQEMICEI